MTYHATGRIVPALVIALLSFSAQAETQKALEKSLMTNLRANATDSLKDGPSARFRGEFLSDNDPDDTHYYALCGQVNAKNAYGAYAGFHYFIATSSGLVIFEHDSDRAFGNIWPVWCSRPLH